MRVNRNNGILCDRCKKYVREIHFWNDGTHDYICTPCKEELESGGLRILKKEEECQLI